MIFCLLFSLWNDVIYYVPFLCESNCFLWVSQSCFFLYFFLLLGFQLWDYLYLWIFILCTWYTYNLNISIMWLIKTLLFLRMESLLPESRIQKIAVCGAKVGKISLFSKHWTESDHNVFPHINYRKNTVEIDLFQKYEFFIRK